MNLLIWATTCNIFHLPNEAKHLKFFKCGVFPKDSACLFKKWSLRSNTVQTRASYIHWVLNRFQLLQISLKLNIFLYCQFGPFFEVYIGPDLIWAKFGITVMSSGLIDITGSSFVLCRRCRSAFSNDDYPISRKFRIVFSPRLV